MGFLIERIIAWSIKNRILILIFSFGIIIWGTYVAKNIPVDAIPDLSDVQVIIKTNYPGRSPQVIESQVTYPLTTTMLAVAGVKTVRGFSYFGQSFVYVIFDEKTNLYWARSRVLEYLNQATSKLPPGVRPELGPDATGVGWVYQYALVDRTGKHDIGQLRALQDWFLKFELRTVPGVAEVATVGGMVKQFQVILDPYQLIALKIPLLKVKQAIQNASQESGGSVLEMGEADYMIRGTGYLQSIQDIKNIPIYMSKEGVPVLLKNIARVQLGPQVRLGVAELNGEGEVVGGIVVMRFGENALKVIQNVKEKIENLKKSLPKGVEVVTTYDRSTLILKAIAQLKTTLVKECLIVGLVCLIFLLHFRSALVIVLTLPLGILCAFIIMYYQGINANIMSLSGIAIAIGAMVDAAVVMIENAHKHIEAWQKKHSLEKVPFSEQITLIIQSTKEVGPPLFSSLLIITVSFLPIFTLQAQEGLLFTPLALTKTYAMAAAAGLSITLVPALMVYFVRGKIRSERQNPLNNFFIALYEKIIRYIFKCPKIILLSTFVLMILSAYPFLKSGSEFMPPFKEGDLLYMPSAFPGLAIGKAAQTLQQTDKLIKHIPEIESVFGKAGRAETSTDPAPLEMFETVVQLKDSSQWRPGMTYEGLIDELNKTVQISGLVNLWVQPIRNRIDMLSTGIKSQIGLKVSGPDLKVIDSLGQKIEGLLKSLPETASVYAERNTQGRYVIISFDRLQAARYGFNMDEVSDLINNAIGGENIAETVDGLQRFPINIRFPREFRDSPQKIKELPLLTPSGSVISLGRIADIKIVSDGPSQIKTENARPSGWIFIDSGSSDPGSYIAKAKALLEKELTFPSGYSLSWAGQYEYMERVVERLMFIVPLTLFIIFFLLWVTFKNFMEPLIILLSLPFALSGGLWLTYILGFNLSVAVAAGFIALLGVAAEFGVVMLIYLNHSLENYQKQKKISNSKDLILAITEGAVLRVRPKTMTVAVIISSLIPIMFEHGTGSELMQRIAAPMIGGMVTAPLFSMIVIPIVYFLWKKRQLLENT